MRILRALAVCLAFGAACNKTRDVGLDITLPSGLADATEWFEVGAYKDAPCAAIVPMLANGVPEGATARVAFRRADPSGPKFGDIPNGRYAFAAVARDAECAVLAAGCVELDVGGADKVNVPMVATEEPTGKCTLGATCQAARCVPANDNSDPSIGTGCSLELLGAGPLVNSAGGEGTLVSGPSIAATNTGFIIVYREIDPNAGGARIILLPIDNAGGALRAEKPGLPDRCASSDETDSVGLIMKGDDGMIALARPSCGAKPALELLNFSMQNANEPGVPAIGKFLVSVAPTDVPLALGAARSAAVRPSGALVVFTEGGVARIDNMDAEKGIVGPSGSFGATSGTTGAWIAANDKVLALLSAGPAEAAPIGDAGADAGIGSPVESGTTDTMLRLLMLPAATPADGVQLDNQPPPITFPGAWGSIAALAGRVIVLSDGTGPGRSVTYRAFDLNKDTATDTSGFSVEGGGAVTAGDVTILGNRAYFAVLKQGAVALHVYDNASTTLTPRNRVLFAREPRISAINRVRDGRISVAATESRVAVVWTTAKVLGKNDPAGGYAVFGCTN
jgi:hypothetical protein